MKEKWVWQDVLFFLIALAFFVGVGALLNYCAYRAWGDSLEDMILAKQYLIKAAMIGAYAMLLYLVAWYFVRIRVLRFNEKGVYFYGLLGLRCFCAWSDIERVERFRAVRAYKDNDRCRLPDFIAVYTKDHFVRPVLDSQLKIKNLDRNGWRYKINKDDSEIAIIIGIDTLSEANFVKYLAHYRPDIEITYDVSMLSEL